MDLNKIIIVLIAIAVMSFASCGFNTNESCDEWLHTWRGKVALVAIAIIAASQHIICGLVIILLFIIYTNNFREGNNINDLDKLELHQLSLKNAFNKKICDPRFAKQSQENEKEVVSMTKSMTLVYPHGYCDPCSNSRGKNCVFEISAGGDQLKASEDIKPTSTRK